MFGEQLPRLAESDAETLITLTLGGNDLLSAFSTKPRASLLERIARDVGEAYEFLWDAIRRLEHGQGIVDRPEWPQGRRPGDQTVDHLVQQ